VTDEHRYGLIPGVRKCWTLRDERKASPKAKAAHPQIVDALYETWKF